MPGWTPVTGSSRTASGCGRGIPGDRLAVGRGRQTSGLAGDAGNPAGHRYRCPAGIPEAALAEISRSALDAHRALHCSGYSRSDFLVTRDGEVFWLEANTLPGLSARGNLATMAGSAGISYDELIQTILATAHRDGYRP